MRKKALVVGVGGQDGYYLSANLTGHGYEIWGIERKGLRGPHDRLPKSFNLIDGEDWIRLMDKVSFDEIYYLAAAHHASEDRHKAAGLGAWRESWATHVEGWVACLEALRQKRPSCRSFYAASSLVFGCPLHSPQDEQTPFRPDTIYGTTKAAGFSVALHYRQHHGLYTSTGLLYNHESPRRPTNFVSQKIVQGLANVKRGQREALTLECLDAVVDWGYAPDYVDAMRETLQPKTSDDYVIATGQPHTVADFAREVCRLMGLDMSEVVREKNRRSATCHRGAVLIGNPTKLQRTTGWTPTTEFKEMIFKLVEAAL